MKRDKKIILLVFALLAISVITAMATLRSQHQDRPSHQSSQSVDEKQWPLTDYNTTAPSDPVKRARRQAKDKRHDRSEWSVNPADAADSTVRVDVVDPRLPALPVTQSKAVVIGEVTEAHSYLSNDKTGIYSEFTLRVAESLKNDVGAPLNVGYLIELEREGGRVRFPSGRVHFYSVDKEVMPKVGGKYIFFLTDMNQEQSFHILTGYELRDGSVFPLDELPQFKSHQGESEIDFLNALRTALIVPAQTPSN